MNSIKISVRRAGSLFAAAALVLSAAVPAMVSAATVTERSIELSSSVTGETANYEINFTAVADAGAVVVDFCSDSPVLGETCTAPTGFSLSSATVGGDFTKHANSTASKLIVTGTIDVDTETAVTIPVTGVTNPSSNGVMYARIVTFTDDTGATAYTSGTPGAHVDDGSVALSITDGFRVGGTVEETMVFCVSGEDDGTPDTSPIATGCTGDLTSPDITLGTDGVLSTTPSEDTIYTQISTNAVGGAVVSLKSDAAGCGGLLRAGTGTAAERCGIAPITTAGSVSALSGAQFGLKLGNLAGASGTTAVVGSSYDTTNYYMGFDSDGEETGVTSPYGDPVYTTNNAPVEDGTADLTFAAAMSSVTPAGNYSANFSLIATGKF